MNNRDEVSIQTLHSNKEKMDSFTCRIDFIRALMKNQEIKPLIDISDDEEDEDFDSNDTRHKLKKRTLGFTEVMLTMGKKIIIKYIKSGTNGHTFRVVHGDPKNPDYEYGLKVVAYAKKDSSKSTYGDIYDLGRPENAEIHMLKELSKFVMDGSTPHIVLPICTFDTDIDNFVHLIEEERIDEQNEKYKEFVERWKNNEFYDNVSILVSEWANRGDFIRFIKDKLDILTPLHWKVLFFQIISVLAVIQSVYPAFRHNDLKPNNILVHKLQKENPSFNYVIEGKTYTVCNIGYRIKIWDFDFACIPGVVDNKKVMSKWAKGRINVTPDQNRYYDLHYFFNTLTKKPFFSKFMVSSKVPQEAKDFVRRIVPLKYQDKKFTTDGRRILVNKEITTPKEILENDVYFEEFRRYKTKKKQTSRRISKKNNNEDSYKIRRLLMGSKDNNQDNNDETSRESKESMESKGLKDINDLIMGGGNKKRRVIKSKSKSKGKRGVRPTRSTKTTRSISRSKSRTRSRPKPKPKPKTQSKSNSRKKRTTNSKSSISKTQKVNKPKQKSQPRTRQRRRSVN